MSEFSLLERSPQPTAIVRSTIAVSEIPEFLGRAYQAVMRVLAIQGVTPMGEPFAYCRGAPTTTVDIEAGFQSRFLAHQVETFSKANCLAERLPLRRMSDHTKPW